MEHKMANILKEICDRRLNDIAKKGYTLGHDVPETRTRPIVPFLPTPGTILEVKRASPSKGDIMPDLDSVKTAGNYMNAGTAAISVLTEENYFKGSLCDLKAVAEYVNAKGSKTAVLRKDFLLEPEEIEISYRLGADAVLLIARILETEKLIEMASKAFSLGLSILLELRDEEAVEKAFKVLHLAKEMNAEDKVVLGVNSRDLKTFTIDLLIPLKIKCMIEKRFESIPENERPSKIRVISESGVLSPEAAYFTGTLGFDGILIGEAVAKDSLAACEYVKGFLTGAKAASENQGTYTKDFWTKIAGKINKYEKEGKGRPLVKICGITNEEDAEKAALSGADLLGFICEEKFGRHADLSKIENIRKCTVNVCTKAGIERPCFVGVITMPESSEAKKAFELLYQGVLDAIQFHGCEGNLQKGFKAFRFSSEEQLSELSKNYIAGNMRLLLDAYIPGLDGGTGTLIPESLIQKASEKGKLWMAGGINPENVYNIIHKFTPELIDISSGVEKSIGRKDHNLIDKLFKEINK